ncbi:periodic tryptophan protein 1 homolog isoform X2 [Lingula anatina]|uniref:Periodic tryptophan protein 1 homolog isoform X2 n=1 Tax=Lingula anatina TaxID=7574 RepID=A0A1S3K2X8_LINAN|nr:periodic tryptophan protein 1 homolog isoform X2 [Lingula anatina]|eukprot:XP_013416611.1 periodic tryptophan protein 1 homolog isoform X2 [Lingula anatina]
MKGFVPCLTWVKKGVAKATPDKVQVTKEELEKIIKDTKQGIANAELGDEEEDDGDQVHDMEGDADLIATGGKKKIKKKKRKEEPEKDDVEEEDVDDIIAEYGLENYDEDEEVSSPWDGIAGLTYYASNDDDPYITLKDEDDSDNEDFTIKPTDNLLAVARVQQDCTLLEIHVYNEEEANFYCHHDIILPSFPLALEWLNYDPGEQQTGNMLAVSSMEPTIDLWDLDVIDCLEPTFTLGTKVKKSKKKKNSATAAGHTDAVLDLSWNKEARNVLASGSADFTIGLWDLSQGTMVTSIRQHKEKVQTLEWHPFEAQSLLSGSFDQTVKVYDCRCPNDTHKTWQLKGEIERVTWNHFSPFHYLASTDQGFVYYVDARMDKPVFTLSAHDKAVTGLRLSSQVPGLLVTSSADKAFKVWDIENNKPECILDKQLGMGELQCVADNPDAAFVFAIGGESALKVWDIRESAAVRKHFEGRNGSNLVNGAEVPMDVDAVSMGSLSLQPKDSQPQSKDLDKCQTEEKKKKKKKKKKKPMGTQ